MTTLTALNSSTQSVNHAAVVDAVLRAIYNAYDSKEWMDFAQVIRENQEAKEELDGLLECGSEEENGRYAFGLGIVAGMPYAASTGATLNVPPFAELKLKDTLEKEEQAQREATRKATPDAPQVV